MTTHHGAMPRGLMATKSSPLYEGHFGRMFRSLDAAQFGATDAATRRHLTALGAAMSADFDAPKDGKDEEESGIPALYTYLGQFVDHDITFDPHSVLQRQNDPDALVDFRTPALDLDNVYGRGPDDQPYMYEPDGRFFLGDPIRGGGDPDARDLPRNTNRPRRALIGDPRNDENSIVSQLQGLFLRFHNRMRAQNPGLPLPRVQELVRYHYQYVVLNDFLPRIVHSSVLDALKTNGRYDRHKLEFYCWRNDPFMPVEFSVAAYRLGHSMVRPGYRLNDEIRLPIFPVPGQGFPEGLTGFRAMKTEYGIDWGRFIDVDVRAYDGSDDDKRKRLQFAYRIDTSLVNPLAHLPAEVASHPSSLAQRNLLRAWSLGLPSGQAVARAMGVEPLHDDDILIGKAVDEPDPSTGPIAAVSPAFEGNCPLWTYILAEAALHPDPVPIPVKENAEVPEKVAVRINTPKLGPVGGRIVAEVLLGLLFGDRNSFLSRDPRWHPENNRGYALSDFVRYALGR